MLGLNYFQVVICLIRVEMSGNYFTPASASTPVSAIYGAGVWMGGVDRAGSIKVSATTYSYDGSDFYTGPLDILGYNGSNCL
jgi:hypothetical protein